MPFFSIIMKKYASQRKHGRLSEIFENKQDLAVTATSYNQNIQPRVRWVFIWFYQVGWEIFKRYQAFSVLLTLIFKVQLIDTSSNHKELFLISECHLISTLIIKMHSYLWDTEWFDFLGGVCKFAYIKYLGSMILHLYTLLLPYV